MSRVGKVPVRILPGVKVEIKDTLVKVDGPKGKLSHQLPTGILVKIEKDTIVVEKSAPEVEKASALHGLTRTLIFNMVQGAHTGFSKELEIIGVGYRAAVKGSVLSMTLGFSHPVDFELPQGITAKVENNTKITLTGADKVLVGMVAAKVRGFKKPEPYQGKGIKYTGEHIIRKQGKAAGAK